MWKEFREFIARGNVFDLAVGIVIGAAFTAVVNSFVNDLLMPIIGFILGGADFSNYFIVLKGRWARRSPHWLPLKRPAPSRSTGACLSTASSTS